MTAPKLFVLDTNVILHDSACLYQFEENDVVIPITVLEELDQFKKGKGILNFHAREFARSLDTISGDKIFNGGVAIGPGKGKLVVRLENGFHEKLKINFSVARPDHHILNAAYQLSLEESRRQVVLISKDVNMRMKAKSLGLPAEDYTTDQVRDITELYKGCRTEE
ncbi:MAG: ribonuclease, partial [Desulfobacterales bacterium]|nr:ribonuclease [Desulfobacterales bacterium]